MASFSQSPFLITSRKFPQDNKPELESVLTKSYTEVALAVNARTIGLFQTVQTNTGNQYFQTGDPQSRTQSFRKIFRFGAIAAGATLNITHDISGITECTSISGTCVTDVPDFRPIPFVSVANVNEQISIVVDDTQITLVNGAGSPNIVRGIVVLEYLLN